MSRDNILKSFLLEKVDMTPKGYVADGLTPEQFWDCHELFFDKISAIHDCDISHIEGYGQLNEQGKTEHKSSRESIVDSFAEYKEGYWYNWREMFSTTLLEREFFERYYKEMESRISYCEGHRYLVNDFMYFENMITDGHSTVGFPDWTFAGIGDFLVDFAIMDLNKPYMKIPELLIPYFAKKGIHVPDFKERFLCMGYLKGLHGLRWHASIEDEVSCTSIMKSMSELKDRIYAL